MVKLLVSSECQNGDHDKCEGGQSLDGMRFGGWRCTCHCHLQEDKQISAAEIKGIPWKQVVQLKVGENSNEECIEQLQEIVQSNNDQIGFLLRQLTRKTEEIIELSNHVRKLERILETNGLYE